MIISCNNCNKKFKIDSNIIPEKGRLLECNSCNHQWFFKKKALDEVTEPVKIHKPIELTNSTQSNVSVDPKDQEEEERNLEEVDDIVLLDKTIKNDLVLEKISINDKSEVNEDNKIKIDPIPFSKNFNILSLIFVFIITFIALVVVLDTFQAPISKIFPNIEFLLYNLYETINDIELFLKDLI